MIVRSGRFHSFALFSSLIFLWVICSNAIHVENEGSQDSFLDTISALPDPSTYSFFIGDILLHHDLIFYIISWPNVNTRYISYFKECTHTKHYIKKCLHFIKSHIRNDDGICFLFLLYCVMLHMYV